ncbi:MAG: NfeD family protein [Sulfurovum sp.]|nr:MAG: NfeD family protein [Sulfurovum sp.]
MIELVNQSVLWWHWIVFGIVLLILEMMTGTFFMLGLGLSAVIVGIIAYFTPLSFSTELILWIVLSILAILAWVKWIKDKSVSNSGQSNYTLDTLGTVSEKIQPNHRGKVIFDAPVLGNTSWHASAKVPIEKETRIEIVQINGQLIEVKPIQ